MKSSLHRATTLNPRITRKDVGPRISDLSRPFFIAHRGGGGTAPENSLDAYDQALALGCDAIEAGDIQSLADGGLVSMHDSTWDRTTNATGNVATTTTLGLGKITLDSSVWFGSGWGDAGTPPTFGQILARYGGRTVLVPEIKDQSSTTASRLCVAVKAAGLADSVLIQCFSWPVCQAIAAAGCNALFLMTTGTEQTPATILGSGVKWVGIPSTVATSVAATLKAGGLGVVVYTPDLQKDIATWWATGNVDGFFTNQPLYVAGQFNGYKYRAATAPWVADGRRSHGMTDVYSLGTGNLASVIGSAGAYRFQPAATHRSAILMGWGCPLANAASNYTITVPFTIDTIDTDATSFVGCYFGMSDDTTGPNNGDVTGGATGWLALLRQNGQMILYKGNGSTYTLQVSVQGPAISGGGSATFTVTVSSTSVRMTRTDTPAAMLSSSVTAGSVTSLPVNAVPTAIPSGTVLVLANGQLATTNGITNAGATSITINSLAVSSTLASGSSALWALNLSDATTRGAYWHLRSNTKNGVGLFSWGAASVS